MLRLADSWVWDAWYCDDGEFFHAFFLRASRALGNPELRHHRASIGHAVSRDLTSWTLLPDALVHADSPAFDDQATWTGSVVRGPDRMWHLFYTGISREHLDSVQRILHAASSDLITWTRVEPQHPVVTDPRWYQTHAVHGREDWRDPWVFFDATSDEWHMLVSACANAGPADQRGTVAHATSPDLATWTVQPPLARETRFRQLEVIQTEVVDGSPVIVWCMLASDVHAPGMHSLTGTWTAPADSLLGPFHFDRAEPIAVPDCYAGRIVRDRAGTWNLLTFVDREPDGSFGGYIGDPIALELTERGTLQPRS